MLQNSGNITDGFNKAQVMDKLKELGMGDIAKKYGDFIIVSSDNYSDDCFEEIFNDIGITEYYAKIKNLPTK